jgi:guanine deaminase
MNHEKYLAETIQLAVENVEKGTGGPFAAIIVKNGEIVGIGKNSVTTKNDPTAHAEVQAIRNACKKLGTFQLDDCILYSSCEPCPMCFGAIYWARPKEVYFAANKDDAAAVGFDDAFIYEELKMKHKKQSITFHEVALNEKTKPFDQWENNSKKVEY